MRLVGHLPDRRLVREFSYFLKKEQIQHEIDPPIEQPIPPGAEYRIWVIDEDEADSATDFFNEFVENPENPKFLGHMREAKRLEDQEKQTLRKFHEADRRVNPEGQRKPKPRRRRFLPITLALTAISVVIFFYAAVDTLKGAEGPTRSAKEITPLYQALMYDYPIGLDLLNRLQRTYNEKELEEPQNLPGAGRKLVHELDKNPFWQGFYTLFLRHYHSPDGQWATNVPLFEKIGEGEVWRLFTPSLLHADLWHLVFNVIALLYLGNQVEGKMGWWRYFLLVVISSLVSNTAQYLMTGPNFLGLSGIVYALFGFMWMRQKKAPWEGYLLGRGLSVFVWTLLSALIVLQFVSLGFELAGQNPIAPNIANTAHIAGIVVGVVFARIDKLATQMLPI